jgi:hypothetical protein
MYHDQGLPVLKTLGFKKAVNITLGLPFIRTSVDHGTALSLAGTGVICQNFLTDNRDIYRIVATIAPMNIYNLLEIGPNQGAYRVLLYIFIKQRHVQTF